MCVDVERDLIESVGIAVSVELAAPDCLCLVDEEEKIEKDEEKR
jgi:hypothetical protein